LGLLWMILFGVIPFGTVMVATGDILSGDVTEAWAWKIPRLIFVRAVFLAYVHIALKIANRRSD